MTGKNATPAKGAIKGANTPRRKNVGTLGTLQAGRGFQGKKMAVFGQECQANDVALLTESARRRPRQSHGGKVPLHNGLTARAAARHTSRAAPDASGAGCRNPFLVQAQQAPKPGAFSLPGVSLWLLVRGRLRPGRYPVRRFPTPAPAATIPAVGSGLAAPFNCTGANP